jgi:glycosyltransferase involved in cell wall biosynthesis
LLVSTADNVGGGHLVPWNLFQAYRARGYDSWLVVDRKLSNDSHVLRIPNDELRGNWAQFWLAVVSCLRSLDGRLRGVSRLSSVVRGLAEPRRWLDQERGIEDFHFPGTSRLLDLGPQRPDILHLHNLHGGYFDLRALAWLSQQLPVVLTLHDAWLISGHCAHSFDCERWKTGCGECPDLGIYPAVKRDATAFNWQRKKQIYSKSRLYVATPSRWLMEKVGQSSLASAVVDSRVISNGIDLSIFRPADMQTVRAALGLPQDWNVVVFAANGVSRNIFKDYSVMRAAVAQVAERSRKRRLLFIGLGEDAPPQSLGEAQIRFIPYQSDPVAVARYYQAADIYIHAARAEAWGLTITEALACGTPVVATAVGGIPEQIRGFTLSNSRNRQGNKLQSERATGILVPKSDARGMAVAIERLLDDDEWRRQMGESAARDARERFDFQWQVDGYLDWYKELVRGATSRQEKAGGIG